MFGFGGLPLAIAGTWLLPVAVTVVKNGWPAVREIPTELHIFPRVPTWIDPQSTLFLIVNYGTLTLALASACAGLLLSIKLWRYLVVKKLRWMTEDQADAYLKRIAEKG